MKVYVIENDYYSDRHIIGVTETEEEAKKICDAIYDCEYSEWDTNHFQVNQIRFEVTHFSGDEWVAELDRYHDDSNGESYCYYDGCYIVFAMTPEQAIKIAQDMEAEIKAKKAGIV